MSASPFRALRSHAGTGGIESRLDILAPSDLTPGELLVRVRYAGVNYKDSLAVTGRAKIMERLPRIAGIELVGEVIASEDEGFAPGTHVLVHGFGTGIAHDGGFSEIARVPAKHAMRVPDGLSTREAAIIGVPGFTVALALDRFEAEGLTQGAGPVAVSGAGGAVGMMAVSILRRAGYEAAALTRRAEAGDTLRALGATDIVLSADCRSTRPLEPARFAAAIDNVGGEVLGWLLRSLKPQGQLASVGNASGIAFTANVLPFIMREVRMFGVVANAPWPVRTRLWQRLAGEWTPDFAALAPHVREIGLDDLPDHCRAQVEGRTAGRTLLAFRG